MNGKRAIKKNSANYPEKKSLRLKKEAINNLDNLEQIAEENRPSTEWFDEELNSIFKDTDEGNN